MLTRIALTVTLLVCSNIFMTYAWYNHLRKPSWPLLTAILASWGLAFFEYLLQVPANRYGSVRFGGPLTTPQLKIAQEAITLLVFSIFTLAVMKERLRPNDVVAFILIFAAVAISWAGRGNGPATTPTQAPPPAAAGAPGP
jgi:uncharacterized protein (DUF486 family)